MINLWDVRYVHLGTRDLDAAVDYCTRILGLEVGLREDKRVYFRSDDRDHTLCYFEGDPADQTVGFELRTLAELDAAVAALEAAGRPVRRRDAGDCALRRVMACATFEDPTGNSIDLVVRPFHSGRRHFPSRDTGNTGFSHVGLKTTDPERDEAFWTQICNARVSDWIGKVPLLRIDAVHHKIALFPAKEPGIQHVNHQVESVDDIMRNWYFLTERQVRIVFGPGRHPTSSAMFLYFEGPNGMVYEFSSGVRDILDEESYQPRQFPFGHESFCMWGAKPDIPEFRS